MIPLSLDSLYDFLSTKSFDIKRQPETNQLYTIFNTHEQDVPLFLRIMDEGEFLQLITFIPVTLDRKTVADLGRLLHLLNKEIDIPGFGMEEKAKLIFYRIVLPAIEGEVSGDIVAKYIKSAKVIIETFFPVIAAVVTGGATFADIMKKANGMTK